jgi:hypothetical protein
MGSGQVHGEHHCEAPGAAVKLSWWLIALCGLAYLWVCFSMSRSDPWMALVYFGYSVANVGLVMKALGK